MLKSIVVSVLQKSVHVFEILHYCGVCWKRCLVCCIVCELEKVQDFLPVPTPRLVSLVTWI